MKHQLLIGVMIVLFSLSLIEAQPGSNQSARQMPGGTITGRVFDKISGQAIEYAEVILYRQADSSLVTGTISGPGGKFELASIPPGIYRLEIHFIGFHPHVKERLRISPRNREIDLGDIYLEPTTYSAPTVEVEGERPVVTFQLEKKVIDVSKDLTNLSGTAVEVLENVPSVTVDIEGNVSLRGSSNFTLLIDNAPTLLEPSEALQQIPASSIERIEIITNPSAKYDPEGTSGIINIILKKKKQQGIAASASLDAGLQDKSGADVLVNFQNHKQSIYLGGNYGKQVYPGTSRQENRTTLNQVTSIITADGTSSRSRSFYGLRGGGTYRFTPRDALNWGISFGNRAFKRGGNLDYLVSQQPGDIINSYKNKSEFERSGNFLTTTLNFQHRFPREKQELSAQLVYNYRTGDEYSINELLAPNNLITEGQKNTEKGPGRRLDMRLDYVHPFNENARIEAGYQGQMGFSEDRTQLFLFDSLQAAYVVQPQYNKYTEYKRNIHGFYGLAAAKWKNLAYQLGLRAEYTDRAVRLPDEALQFTINRWDYFPTVHLSYQFPGGQQLMSSYTRRIQRPRGWFLEPFETWIDAYNIRKGNPNLKPEYIDSYEAGFQTFWGKNLFSAELYYRVTNNKVDRVHTVYSENVTLHTMENVGKDYALGAELLVNADLFRWWNINYMANLYDYRVKGTLYNRDFERSSFNWGLRLNNAIKISRSTQVQLNTRYNSPTVSSQGRSEGFVSFDLAVKHDIVPRIFTATLQVRDVFGTQKREFTSEAPNFYDYRYFKQDSPIVILNLRININNFKQERNRRTQEEGMSEEEDDF